MLYHVAHYFKSMAQVESQQHICADIVEMRLQLSCLLTAHLFDIAIKVVNDLPVDTGNLFNLEDFSFIEKRLVLSKHVLDGHFELIRLVLFFVTFLLRT